MNSLVIIICICLASIRFTYALNYSDSLLSRDKRLVDGACDCLHFTCGCCTHLEEKEIHLNSTICVNATYLVHDYGISLTVTVDKYAIFNETVSVRNPPPICLGVPYVKEFADVCIRFYDIDATKTYLHACLKIEARMKVVLIAQYEIGCFNIGQNVISTGHKPLTEHEAAGKADGHILKEDPPPKSNASYTTAVAVGIAAAIIVLVALGVTILAKTRGYLLYRPADCTQRLTTDLKRTQSYNSLLMFRNEDVKC